MSNSTEQSYQIMTAAQTDKGKTRNHNEDSYEIFPATIPSIRDSSHNIQVQVAVVADGIGGAEGGERASRLAVDTIRQQINQQTSTSSVSKRLDSAIMRANDKINDIRRKDPRFDNMGTTIVAAIIIEGRLYVSHAGDSRAYLIRGEKIEQLTIDHTWVQEAIEAGIISVEEGKHHPNKNVVKRFLGTNEPLKVDNQIINLAAPTNNDYLKPTTSYLDLQAGDIILLCTDGLTDMVEDKDIEKIVRSNRHSAQTTVNKLIDKANENGGKDNITAAVMTWPDGSKVPMFAALLQNPKLFVPLLVGLLLLVSFAGWSLIAGEGPEDEGAQLTQVAVVEDSEIQPTQDTGKTNEQGDTPIAATSTAPEASQTNSEQLDTTSVPGQEATSTAVLPPTSTPFSTPTLAPGETRVPDTPSPTENNDASSESTTEASTGTDSQSGESVETAQSPAQPTATQNSQDNQQNNQTNQINTPISPSNTPIPPSNTPIPQSNTNEQEPSSVSTPTNTPFVATNTPFVPTNTPFVPTNTPFVPTNTPFVPTNTPFVPTNTPFVPTNTPFVPTNTPFVPTNTPFVPTNTPFVPTNTPVPVQRNVGVTLLAPSQNQEIRTNSVDLRVQVNGFQNGDRLQLRAGIDPNNLFNEGISFTFDGSAHVANLNYQPGNNGFGQTYIWQVIVFDSNGTQLGSSSNNQFRWEAPGGGSSGGSTGDSSGP